MLGRNPLRQMHYLHSVCVCSCEGVHIVPVRDAMSVPLFLVKAYRGNERRDKMEILSFKLAGDDTFTNIHQLKVTTRNNAMKNNKYYCCYKLS